MADGKFSTAVYANDTSKVIGHDSDFTVIYTPSSITNTAYATADTNLVAFGKEPLDWFLAANDTGAYTDWYAVAGSGLIYYPYTPVYVTASGHSHTDTDNVTARALTGYAAGVPRGLETGSGYLLANGLILTPSFTGDYINGFDWTASGSAEMTSLAGTYTGTATFALSKYDFSASSDSMSATIFYPGSAGASAIYTQNNVCVVPTAGGGGGGGIDSATCSAIASAYAESAASGKQDSSAMTAYQPVGDYYSASNPSGFITGVDLSEYATTAYVDSSVSSKQDSSAMSAYAMSADVSGCINTVSSNSASWGGGGGIDSATCSAIASAYVESGMSGKVDISSNNNIQISAKGLTISGGTAITARYDNSMAVLQTYPTLRLHLHDLAADKRAQIYTSGISGNGGGTWQYGTAEYNNLTSVYNTVSGNSANWGGGVDSATVSAIASAYVESGVSGKLDESAFSSVSGSFLTAIPAGYATETYVDSSVSGKQDTLTFSYSGSYISAINGSAIYDSVGGGMTYTGVAPIIVDNTASSISLDTKDLAVDSTLTAYDSGTSAVLGVNVSSLFQAVPDSSYATAQGVLYILTGNA